MVLPQEQRRCPNCHRPYADFPGTDDGEIIEIDVRAYRRHYRRHRYRRTCTCANLPRIVTAPPPPKVVPKGLLGVSIWVVLLVGKFAQYQPTHRLLADLRDHDLDLSAATVADGLRHIKTLMQPIYDGLARHQRDQDFWQGDETRWMVFVQDEQHPSQAWSLFVMAVPTPSSSSWKPSAPTTCPNATCRTDPASWKWIALRSTPRCPG